MAKAKKNYHEMLFIQDSHRLFLNRCSLCTHFDPPYEVGSCENTPADMKIDDCEQFDPIAEAEISSRILKILYLKSDEEE